MSTFASLLLAWGLAQTADAGNWRLVGAYDSSAVQVSAVSELAEEEAGEPQIPFSWQPNSALLDYCGTPRAPRGLGVMESVAISERLTSALVLLLRSAERDAEPMQISDLAVSVVRSPDSTDPAERMELRPAVEARRLKLSIENQIGSGDAKDRQWTEVVRTQLGIQLCLEHMLGRAWSGGNEKRVREAFLLTRPQVAGAVDRRYLVGQQEPVAAYLGPPDACELGGSQRPNSTGQVSPELVPADVWQGRVRPCGPDESEPTMALSPSLPLQAFGSGELVRVTAADWDEVQVVLRRGVSEVPTVEVIFNDETRLEPTLLLSRADSGDPGEYGVERMEDLLGRLPQQYPLIERDGHRYTVLLIPEWQLAEARQRWERMKLNPTKTMQQPVYRAPRAELDGVSWILQHPELLRVQVRPDADSEALEWPDLAVAIQGGTLGVRDWGYAAGLLGGRAPVVLPQKEPVRWAQVVQAQRGQQQSFAVAAFVLLALAFLTGFRRLSELWLPIPEERADYWPGVGDQAAEDNAPDGPSGMLSTQGVE